MSFDLAQLPEDAFALRPVRIIADELREYDAITFPGNPRGGCSMYLRRCQGQLLDDDSDCMIDVINKDWDIIAEYPITTKGFEYLRRTLKFRCIQELGT